jgi:hypothetical protein
MYPLSLGTIGKIEGADKIKEHPSVVNYLQYYEVGDSIQQKNIGTLSQHFCRITYIANNESEAASMIEYFQKTLKYSSRSKFICMYIISF